MNEKGPSRRGAFYGLTTAGSRAVGRFAAVQ